MAQRPSITPISPHVFRSRQTKNSLKWGEGKKGRGLFANFFEQSQFKAIDPYNTQKLANVEQFKARGKVILATKKA